ncbi:MAG: organic hydroperoxide resistance protein [Ferruginibacter sp.]|nr:organic hydroperoxide resistance protein [Ferruginibacter sp.]
MNKIYTATVTATGGRNGHVQSPDKLVDFDFRSPKALGGANDNYLNPELLFAAGYSACFDSALNRIIKMEKAITGATTVTAHVSIGKLDEFRFGLAVDLEIEVPGVDHTKAEELVQKAHAICPYSNATRGNIDVNLVVKETVHANTN